MSSARMLPSGNTLSVFRDVRRTEPISRLLCNRWTRDGRKVHLAKPCKTSLRSHSRAVSRRWKSSPSTSATQQSTPPETETSEDKSLSPSTSGVDEGQGAVATSAEREPIVLLAEKMGYDTTEGIFGFTPFSELWVGRQAMLGITLGVITEVLSGNTMLQQVGLDVQTAQAHEILFGALWLALFGGTVVGAGLTLSRAKSGKMTSEEYKRYAKFFGMNTEETAEMEASMRKQDGLTKLLEAPPPKRRDTNSALQPNELLWTILRGVAWVILAEERKDANVEKDQPGFAIYAKDVELNGGRMAMLGFVAAILVEAATGAGVMQQLDFYSNIFAAESVNIMDDI